MWYGMFCSIGACFLAFAAIGLFITSMSTGDQELSDRGWLMFMGAVAFKWESRWELEVKRRNPNI